MNKTYIDPILPPKEIYIGSTITYLKPHYKGDRCMDYFKDWRLE